MDLESIYCIAYLFYIVCNYYPHLALKKTRIVDNVKVQFY